ncbi:hypothetical protein [Rhodococcus sp. MTM3W5.2]|uniref:hypothetical protein n=1 Tax=Rhodococcus sp. MTM3W5.2 TaxID=1805827 RepID=UPI0011AE256E|nr:hypothetical protein [Rhodococcus sp. MTM3W5.2]
MSWANVAQTAVTVTGTLAGLVVGDRLSRKRFRAEQSNLERRLSLELDATHARFAADRLDKTHADQRSALAEVIDASYKFNYQLLRVVHFENARREGSRTPRTMDGLAEALREVLEITTAIDVIVVRAFLIVTDEEVLHALRVLHRSLGAAARVVAIQPNESGARPPQDPELVNVVESVGTACDALATTTRLRLRIDPVPAPWYLRPHLTKTQL